MTNLDRATLRADFTRTRQRRDSLAYQIAWNIANGHTDAALTYVEAFRDADQLAADASSAWNEEFIYRADRELTSSRVLR